MKKIEKAKDWAVTLAALKEELAAIPPERDGSEVLAKVAKLERAIAIRASLSAKETAPGSMQFSV